MASLLIGLYSAHDYEGDYLHLLMAWFASQVGEDSASVSIFAEPLGIANKVGLRVLLGRSEEGLAIPEPATISHADRVRALMDRVRVARGLAPRDTPAPATSGRAPHTCY